MIDETFIVSFKAGSSGRFLSNIVWTLLKNIDYELKLSNYNSTHNSTPFATSFIINDFSSTKPFSDKNIFSNFTFIENPGLITVHSYPDFNVISEKFPNTKVIIISILEKDIDEISCNSLLKNGLENLFNNKKNTHAVEIFLEEYKNVTNEEFVGQMLSMEVKQKIFHNYKIRFSNQLVPGEFLDPKIPIDFTKKTLLLNYDQIINNMDLTLEKLCNFVNRNCRPAVINYYKNYLIGRKHILDNEIPWIK